MRSGPGLAGSSSQTDESQATPATPASYQAPQRRACMVGWERPAFGVLVTAALPPPPPPHPRPEAILKANGASHWLWENEGSMVSHSLRARWEQLSRSAPSLSQTTGASWRMGTWPKGQAKKGQ